MDFFQILVLALYTTQVYPKSRSKKYKSSTSDEDSIENLLYYKDCQRQGKPVTTSEAPPMPLLQYVPSPPPAPPPPPRQPECPFPKMCCALTCGNECGSNRPAFVSRHSDPLIPPAMASMQSMLPMPPMQQPHQSEMQAVQPQLIQRRKKKMKFPPGKMGSMQTRRDFLGFTKEKIKGLIAQDDDIRKILKDLVRVTMQKVDLQEMLNSGTTKGDAEANVMSVPTPVYTYDEYDE